MNHFFELTAKLFDDFHLKYLRGKGFDFHHHYLEDDLLHVFLLAHEPNSLLSYEPLKLTIP